MGVRGEGYRVVGLGVGLGENVTLQQDIILLLLGKGGGGMNGWGEWIQIEKGRDGGFNMYASGFLDRSNFHML